MAPADKENDSGNTLRKGKTIEQIYQKKTQLEHILLRPDTYVGSCEHQFQEMFVYDDNKNEIVFRKIDYVPALYKIFDEIIVNAADQCQRDSKTDLVDITIDKQAGSISVMNNGKGIPVAMHKEHKCWVPEMIFGQLLTSDNYDDSEKKVTGGRNGFGAKLTNVFSKKFIIETCDKKEGKKFTQVFENNMSIKNKPKITDFKGSEYTRVTFWPDFAKFGMTKLDNDIAGLMMKRAFDLAGSTRHNCKVILNGKLLPVKTFEEYVQLYTKKSSAEGAQPLIYERCHERWEVGVSLSEGQFQQVSFVNSINTIKGGTHVTHVTDQLVEAILKVVKGKNRGGIEIKPQHVKNHLFVFVNALIENPAFDSQTKEALTTKQSKFGSSCDLPEKLIKQVMKSGVVDMILDWAKAKQKVDMGRQLKGGTKNQARVVGIPKLEDANDAGGKNSQDCTLILTEGDSAKSLAVAGLSVVGRDKYGVFPLKGKVLNVRDANFKQVTGNAEIQNLLKIMGLDIKREYDSTRGLRYGTITLMTDQDHDGSHIKGLLINLVHHWWPSLLRMNGFLKEFVTPIVKVWKEGKKDSERKDEKCFFTVPEYHKWQEKHNGGKGWKSKYYKGLGTSTAKEAKEYFRDIENHELSFKWHDKEDDEAIDLAFNKKRADDRKDWINAYEEGSHVDHSQSQLSYFDFINKELVQFAKYDTSRSVPSVVDGFKPSQRKVLFCAFKKKLKSDIKVAQFVGYISEQSAYHHGETSLENTIINLAQNFVGSNNLNLLVPSGQFGTRLQGGKDHAASRYIYTRLAHATRVLFQPDDDKVLEYLEEEGQSIEPKWYCPILPLVLVNGADGIGTGWSTSVPNFNPREIIRNIQLFLRGEAMHDMLPWYKGFKGTVSPHEKEAGRYDICGLIEKKNDTTLVISELPVKAWTQSYKEFLEEMMPGEGKKTEEAAAAATITDYKEYHTENSVHFEVFLTPEKMKEVEQTGIEKVFKMKSSLSTTNMVLFDADNKIAKYNSALSILQEFCKLRRQVYVKRKAYLVSKLTREKEILSNKARFIKMVVKGELELRKKKKEVLLKELQKLGFKMMSELDAILECSKVEEEKPAKEAAGNEEAEKTDYDYLLGMNLWSLTFEKVEELMQQFEVKKQELDVLRATTIETMWDRDLEELKTALDDIDRLEDQEAEEAQAAQDGRRKKKDGNKSSGAAAANTKRILNAAKKNKADAEDKALLKRPLQEGGGETMEIEKTTWGASAARERSNKDLPSAPPRGEEAPPVAPAAKSRRKNDSGGSGPAAAPAPPPPKEEEGSSLLSRLLGKSTSSTSSSLGSSHAPLGSSFDSSFSSFSSLNTSDDIFSYLKTGDPSDKSSVIGGDSSDFGLPPGLTGSLTSTADDESSSKEKEDTPTKRGKGKGRGRKAKADDDDDDDGEKAEKPAAKRKKKGE
eukprot:TRINITY_DN7678_c0_g2_i1.p1 TRINITY_DN7678_c0_g2~~TRINITY_DN7678_c0_g2_i1.p1  ORF type:complete len:1431 (+),score=413.67 TRINITY_DN7678_c0_g2_i1:106-4398(+)